MSLHFVQIAIDGSLRENIRERTIACLQRGTLRTFDYPKTPLRPCLRSNLKCLLVDQDTSEMHSLKPSAEVGRIGPRVICTVNASGCLGDGAPTLVLTCAPLQVANVTDTADLSKMVLLLNKTGACLATWLM